MSVRKARWIGGRGNKSEFGGDGWRKITHVVAISSRGAVGDGEADYFGLGGKDGKVEEAFQ